MATKGDLSKARTLIDEYHKNDPAYLSNQSQPPHNKKRDEQTYSDNVERWVIRLIQTSLDQPSTSDLDVKQRTLDLFSSIRSAAAAASDSTTKTNEEEWSQEIEILKLAARCQHLGRYLHPRQDHPPGKAGYLKWRRELYQIQADRASTILSQSGFQEDLVNLVASWVAKKGLKVGKADQSEWGAQLLEDSAILVFLEDELESFAEQHQDYQKEKFLDIIRKTWRKLSTQGKEATRQLSMPKGLEELIHQAVGRLEEEEEEEKEKEKAGEGKEKETQETIKVNEEGREQM
ncbi:hypothetical protein IE53DRAFT_43240 [Violaceomyces palustris]|uniref:Uncharacterized protein n=1 Tax=Violaceomyces palustris TaxID=1673888 RepID=A0ACD0P0I3_9BASI|nr:hypothetical protein IE53DRAFT_43240 [Violaceomyces palustris]